MSAGNCYIEKLCDALKTKLEENQPTKCCGKCQGSIGRLSLKDSLEVRLEAPKVKKGDLYQALKRVGDDPVKDVIEETLDELLDEETFRRVVAVFKIATRD